MDHMVSFPFYQKIDIRQLVKIKQFYNELIEIVV